MAAAMVKSVAFIVLKFDFDSAVDGESFGNE